MRDLKENFLLEITNACYIAREKKCDILSFCIGKISKKEIDALLSNDFPFIFYIKNQTLSIEEIGISYDAGLHFLQKSLECLSKNPLREYFYFPQKNKKLSIPARFFTLGHFENPLSKESGTLSKWQISKYNKSYYLIAHLKTNATKSDFIKIQKEYLDIKTKSLCIKSTPASNFYCHSKKEVGGNNYLTSATKAIRAINNGKFSKIVLARAIDYSFKEKFLAYPFFEKIKSTIRSKESTYFFVKNAKNIAFLGVSPELLIYSKNNQLITEAIAGSLKKEKTASIYKFLNNKKELHEHICVRNFILNKLEKNNITNLTYKETPEIITLPNIYHLKTKISASINNNDKYSLLKIANDLHPTPAMCGLPAQKAKKYISKIESFTRGHFSAPIGFFSDNECFLAVAIRCAMIQNKKLRLYAGSGLVNGSIPENEFIEIETKLNTLGKFFYNTQL